MTMRGKWFVLKGMGIEGRIAKKFRAPKPSACWSCGKDDKLSWSNGEWKCSRCEVVVEPD
jgi:ribosomal protein L37AE/L43A